MATGATWMLCLDASAPRTCVCLGRVDEHGDELVVADAREDRANQTSAHLHERLAAALEQAGIAARELGVIACARGPGTFTGSRVAVATAKGLALGLCVPALPVSSLASLAASASVGGGPILALLDARRDQVYGGVYELGARVRACGDEQVATLAELIARAREADAELVDAATPFGPGCGPYADQLPDALRARCELAPGPTPAGLWRASVSALREGDAVDAGDLRVRYLRQSYAQMGINKPKRPVYKSPFA